MLTYGREPVDDICKKSRERKKKPNPYTHRMVREPSITWARNSGNHEEPGGTGSRMFAYWRNPSIKKPRVPGTRRIGGTRPTILTYGREPVDNRNNNVSFLI